MWVTGKQQGGALPGLPHKPGLLQRGTGTQLLGQDAATHALARGQMDLYILQMRVESVESIALGLSTGITMPGATGVKVSFPGRANPLARYCMMEWTS